MRWYQILKNILNLSLFYNNSLLFFLGPYKGRSTELKPYTSGVLTNPNCEYYLNHIALHTLATWNKAAGTGDGKKDEPPG